MSGHCKYILKDSGLCEAKTNHKNRASDDEVHRIYAGRCSQDITEALAEVGGPKVRHRPRQEYNIVSGTMGVGVRKLTRATPTIRIF